MKVEAPHLHLKVSSWSPFEFLLSCSEGLLALLPIAGAEFVRLQAIEHTPRLIHIPADREVIDRSPADDPFRVYDEGGPQRNPCRLVQNPQRRA